MRVEGIDFMPKCVQCGTETGFIGSLTFNKQTGRCGRCESEVKQSLMRFRDAFLNFCSDGMLTEEKWSRLSIGAANDRLNIDEARRFVRTDALNLLNRILIFATANGFIRDEEERNFQYIQVKLAIPYIEAESLLDRLSYLKYITNIRRGKLPTAYPSIRLDTDELCHLEMPTTFHKINAKSTSLISGRFVVTNKKLRFLSVTGGTEIGWNSVMRVQVQSGGIYLELSRKTGNGFYSASDPLLLEAVIDTIVRMTKRQLVGLNSDNSSRHIPQDVRYTVWQRDQGKCVECGVGGPGAYLEFDHVIPFSKGGASTVGNVQLLCRRCNLSKGDRI